MDFTTNKKDIMTDEERNLWIAHSIFDFHFFCCPECDDKSQSKQDFVNHASIYHSGVRFHIFFFLSKQLNN